eukprot:6163477-Pyramimonas_sp.AAC.1
MVIVPLCRASICFGIVFRKPHAVDGAPYPTCWRPPCLAMPSAVLAICVELPWQHSNCVRLPTPNKA